MQTSNRSKSAVKRTMKAIFVLVLACADAKVMVLEPFMALYLFDRTRMGWDYNLFNRVKEYDTFCHDCDNELWCEKMRCKRDDSCYQIATVSHINFTDWKTFNTRYCDRAPSGYDTHAHDACPHFEYYTLDYSRQYTLLYQECSMDEKRCQQYASMKFKCHEKGASCALCRNRYECNSMQESERIDKFDDAHHGNIFRRRTCDSGGKCYQILHVEKHLSKLVEYEGCFANRKDCEQSIKNWCYKTSRPLCRRCMYEAQCKDYFTNCDDTVRNHGGTDYPWSRIPDCCRGYICCRERDRYDHCCHPPIDFLSKTIACYKSKTGLMQYTMCTRANKRDEFNIRNYLCNIKNQWRQCVYYWTHIERPAEIIIKTPRTSTTDDYYDIDTEAVSEADDTTTIKSEIYTKRTKFTNVTDISEFFTFYMRTPALHYRKFYSGYSSS